LKSKKPDGVFMAPTLALSVSGDNGYNNRAINPYFQPVAAIASFERRDSQCKYRII